MTDRRRYTRNRSNPEIPETNSESVPNSVARITTRSMGQRSSRRASDPDETPPMYSQRYSRRSFNFLNPERRLRSRNEGNAASTPERSTTSPQRVLRSTRSTSNTASLPSADPTSSRLRRNRLSRAPVERSPSVVSRESGIISAASTVVNSALSGASRPMSGGGLSGAESDMSQGSDTQMEDWERFTSMTPSALVHWDQALGSRPLVLPELPPELQDIRPPEAPILNDPRSPRRSLTPHLQPIRSELTPRPPPRPRVDLRDIIDPPPVDLRDIIDPPPVEPIVPSATRPVMRSGLVSSYLPQAEAVVPRPPSGDRPVSSRRLRSHTLLERARAALEQSRSLSRHSRTESRADTVSSDDSTTIYNRLRDGREEPPADPSPPPIRRRSRLGQSSRILFSHTDGSAAEPSDPFMADAEDAQRRGEAVRREILTHMAAEAATNAVAGMISAERESRRLPSVFGNDERPSGSDPTPRGLGLISRVLGSLNSEPSNSSYEGPSAERSTLTSRPLSNRLRLIGRLPGTGTILVEDQGPDSSLRMSLHQAQYLQEVLLRISSLLDNLHILAQMHSQIDSGSNELMMRYTALQDDPRYQAILSFATLDPDNMTYEQLLSLDDMIPKHFMGASKELIESKTSLLQFKKGEVYENDSCTICIADFEENDGIRMLPCTHIYHIPCIDDWLKRKKNCPMCRKSIEEKPSATYTKRLDSFKE